MRNLLADPQHAMWALAQKVHGWGRIELVRRMTDVTDPTIKDWVLHEGYRNQIMYEYLAQVAAEVGGLAESLRASPVSERTIDAATEIIAALIAGEGGPVAGMAAYQDGPEVMRLYVEEMDSRAATLKEYACVRAITRYVEQRSEPLESKWTVEVRQEIGRRAAEILSRPQWRDMIVAALTSSDLATFDLGLSGARDLGIDVRPTLTRRLRDDPRDGYAWSKLTWGTVTESDIDEVIALAMELLPLADLASGASDDLGVGLEYRDEGNLGSVVQALKRFPGRGWPVIRVALQNRVRRNRGVAIKALASWTPEQRAENDADAFLARCLEAEVVDALRDDLQALLAFELEPDPPIPSLGED
jgi:hypothetical protein